jgi:soluble cytochrome b562
MIRRKLNTFPPLLVVVLVVAALIFGIAGGVARLHAFADDENPMHVAMEKMDDALKALRKQASDPAQNDASLKLIDEMQTQCVLAKSMVPERAAKEADKKKFVAAYRLEMLKALDELVKLERAVLEGKNDEALNIAKGLTKVKNEGHEKFQVE